MNHIQIAIGLGFEMHNAKFTIASGYDEKWFYNENSKNKLPLWTQKLEMRE